MEKNKISWSDMLGWENEQIEDIKVAAYSYIRQGKYEIALSFFRALIILDDEDIYSKQTLGALYLQLGNPAKALVFLDEALKYDSLHAPTQLNRAKALIESGNISEGLKIVNSLKTHVNDYIANSAKALLMAYSK